MGYEVGFNSNQEVARLGEYGTSVRTNRPSFLLSKEPLKCWLSHIRSRVGVAKSSIYFGGSPLLVISEVEKVVTQ